MHIKLFENFQEFPEFTQKIAKNTSDISITFYKEPYNLKSLYLIEGSFSWKCKLETKTWGISLESIMLTKLEFTVELENEETEEFYYKTTTVPEETLKDPLKYKVDVEGFPLRITNIEVNMRHSEDPEDWKYELTVGGPEE
jgi:hypothetical protein